MDMNKKENIHSGHRKRVKANVVNNGYSQLEDHRLLELILFYSIPQADTNELAHRILDEFGSLDGVMKADIKRLSKVSGVGENTAILLSAIGEMSYRARKVKFKKKSVYKTANDYKELAVTELSAERNENVVVFCFDNSGRLLKTERISHGDEFSASFDIKKIVAALMDSNAANAVISHNHPLSECYPSAGDIDATRNIAVMLRRLGFCLADHIIVDGNDNTFSMYEDKVLTNMFF